MTDLPQPLTPADAELRNFREMPIDVPRLLGSDLAHDESPEACWSAMLLWCVSWHEVPAGSLPDNDEWLAKRAGYWHKGKLDPTWHEVRAGALHGWIKCSDGRLYHPVVAEKVNNAWYSKHRHAHEKLGERLRKRNKARAEKGLVPLEIPDLEQWIALGRPLERELFPAEFGSPSGGSAKPSGGNPGSVPANGGGIPVEKDLKGNEQNGNERRGIEVNTIGSVITGGITPGEGSDDPTIPKDAAEWARYFRDRHGVELDATSVHDRRKAWPLFAGWITAGVSIGLMEQAVKKARAEAGGPIAFLPSYVDRVLASMTAPPPPARQSPEERRRALSKANGDAWLAGSPESDPNVIDMEH